MRHPVIFELTREGLLVLFVNYYTTRGARLDLQFDHYEPCHILNSSLILFTQPLRSGRIWHKVNFLSGV